MTSKPSATSQRSMTSQTAMTSKTSATARRTLPTMPTMPPGKKPVPAAPEAQGETPGTASILLPDACSNAERPASAPVTDDRLPQDIDGLTQAKAPGITAPSSKLDRLLDLLRRPDGTTLEEMCAATGWQVHSVRGAMAGALKRKGNIITSEKQGDLRRYRIGAAS